jgi:AraC-like DNA-binding protein
MKTQIRKIRNKQIKNLYNETLSLKKVSKEFNLSERQIARIVKDEKTTPKPKKIRKRQ